VLTDARVVSNHEELGQYRPALPCQTWS
jgi:hypothetical protein